MAIRGSCLCGGVVFEIDRAIGPAEFCHCNRCRKVSGSNALLVVRVKAEDYRVLSGRELVRSYAAPVLRNPPPYQSTFCSNCGSPVPEPSPQGEFVEIPAGTLVCSRGRAHRAAATLLSRGSGIAYLAT